MVCTVCWQYTLSAFILPIGLQILTLHVDWTRSRVEQKRWKGLHYYHNASDTHMWPPCCVTVPDLPWGQCKNKDLLLNTECKFNRSLLSPHFSYRFRVVDPIMETSREFFWKTAGCVAALDRHVAHSESFFVETDSPEKKKIHVNKPTKRGEYSNFCRQCILFLENMLSYLSKTTKATCWWL